MKTVVHKKTYTQKYALTRLGFTQNNEDTHGNAEGL